MTKLVSSGLLMCRWNNGGLEYFLVHPGGPFFKNKDIGVWSIPKGLPEENEDLLVTAIREFTEETGIIPTPPYYPLSTVQQKGGKQVHAWTFIGEWNSEQAIVSNTFQLEWPPRSGKYAAFPEQDKAAWMDLSQAKLSINPAQVTFLEEAKKIHEAKKTDHPGRP
jgi:predicted NUDIX family NTP pyrophosphohydrolase